MTDKLLNSRYKKAAAKTVLICFPWAGGGSNFYANWGKLVPDFLEVCGITLAGRESRFREPCCNEVQTVIQEATSAIYSCYKDKNIALWGHSMGAHLSFAVALQLRSLHNIQPVHMFISGTSAPHSPQRSVNSNLDVSKMSDDEFIDHLKRLGGTPTDILDNKELLQLFLPPLKADYKMLDDLKYTQDDSSPPLTCDMDIFDGKDDVKHDLEAWRHLTSGSSTITFLPGGHFYLKEQANQDHIIKEVVKRLEGL